MGDRKAAIDFYNKAVANVNDKNNPTHMQQAYSLFSSACHVDPTWAQGFYTSGNNNGDQNYFHSAIACYRRALECNPDDKLKAQILTNLGWRLHCIGKFEEALVYSHRAAELGSLLGDHDHSSAYINLSCIYGILFQQDKSIEYARKAYEINGGHAESQMALAFALLFGRQFKEGFKHFESRFKYKLKEFLQYPYPRWDGEPNRTVYLCLDQGLGDTLSFARFVEPLCKRSKYVHARIQPELLRLFQYVFVHIPNLNLIPSPCPFPVADSWTCFVSLPYDLGLTDDEFRNAKQVTIKTGRIEPLWKVPDRKLHIGIAWHGSPLNDINKHRSIPIEFFLDLYKVPGVQLYSLQVGERSKDMHEGAACAPIMRDMTQHIRDVADTISLVRELDLVICCESALGHIASAADVECWIPYSFSGRDYRIGPDGSDMIWTPKHRIFQQGRDQQWQPVFDRIVEALKEKVDGVARQAA